MPDSNLLYYGDNLDILRRYIPDESVDLIYLDPPFNSERNYNVIFKNEAGRNTDAQLVAFEDAWHWGPNAEKVYAYLTNSARHEGRVPDPVTSIVAALRKGIGDNPMMAYIVEMSVRLVELHRVLKLTGSIFLHCDPTAGHYLRLVLDAIFDARNFQNEIVWKRSSAHSDTTQGAVHLGRTHDLIHFYSKGASPTRNVVMIPFSKEYVESHYRHEEPVTGRRYRLGDLTAAKPGGDTLYEWTSPAGKSVRPYKGRYWAYTKEKMAEFERQGRLVYTKSGMPEYKRYLDDNPGQPLQDIWDDIPPINSQAKERLGYPTQKPEALLERIVALASNPGDIVLDPFCGCGTALVAAQKLERRWIGIDITYLAIAVMKARLKDSFGLEAVKVLGQPTEVEGARQFAQSPSGRYQFQFWVLTLVDAQPVGGKEKKGADRGIDGVITFTDKHGVLQTVLVSVKSGHVNSAMVRDLKGTIEREKAVIGLFLTLEEPTKEMQLEADTAGLFHSEVWKRDYPKVQILSIRELLELGKKPQLPPFVMPTYPQAQKVEAKADQAGLFDVERPLKMVAEPPPPKYSAENES
ncbi:MAG TPA: DNA methyltransferase [Candidatus Dormibacteraeota bacterium]|nr:DNA methyltransferase [Candidatus Dormibacteraeota bacterium]